MNNIRGFISAMLRWHKAEQESFIEYTKGPAPQPAPPIERKHVITMTIEEVKRPHMGRRLSNPLSNKVRSLNTDEGDEG